MYAVIFRATTVRHDAEYEDTAARLRKLALSQSGCVDFATCQ